ncbi:response regulator [Dankookia sp. GCM10030260]|uniref:hybrid sensor histidine kinase/response regulator n=1 Tax=Dankookia sp. GCM10030260 TaxID=3273390 RepID=UPI0036D2BEC4
MVDDEPMLAEELADGLREEGFAVECANSAVAALAALRADPGIGVVVSDIRMPGGNGLSLAAEVLRKEPEATARGVILITAHGSLDQAVEAMRSGVSDFLTKPFSLEDAARAVGGAMQRTRARRADAAERVATDRRLAQAEQAGNDLAGRLSEALAKLEAARPSLPPEAGETEHRLRLLAHELRTPLVPVIGFAELLEGGHAKTPEAAQSYGLHLREAGERMLETVDKLLTWERLRGEARRPAETVDAYCLLTEAVSRTRRLAGQRDVRVALGPLAGTALRVEVDVVGAALAGLLDNAIRATPEHGTVELGAEQAGGLVRLVVRDRGPGVPAALLADPGKPFAVDGSALTRKRDGLGLGLAIARLAAARHGGRLVLRTRPEGGTEAAIELPLA